LLKHRMQEEIRKTGIDIIGDAPWGMHFCQFYETKEDLVDVLVPYFKAGLENNEFCMWVTSEPLSKGEAEKAMREAVPNFGQYLKKGQIEIVPHTEWYVKDDAFDLQRVLNAWIGKLDQALAKGYVGIRVTGNTAWLEKRDWKDFVEYEREVNDVIGKYRILAVCTYSLDKCGASEVLDVVRNHQFALVRRRGEWELIESSELKRLKEALKDSEKEYGNLVDNALVGVYKTNLKGDVLYANAALAKMFEFESLEELMLEGVLRRYKNPKDREVLIENLKKNGKVENFEVETITKTGRPKNVLLNAFLEGDTISGMIVDISERKSAEEEIKKAAEDWMRTFNAISDFVFILDNDFRFVRANKATCDFLKKELEELIGKQCFKVLHGRDEPLPDCPCKIMKVTKKAETTEINVPNLGISLLITVSPLFDENGEHIGCVHVAKDITERKKAELFLNSVIEQSPFSTWISDDEGTNIKMNDACRRLFGIKKDEEVIEKYNMFKDNEARRQGFMPLIKEVFTKGKTVNFVIDYDFSKVKHVKVPGATHRLLDVTIFPIKDVNGKVTNAVVQHIDITEQKKMEKTLKKSEEKFRNIFENANDCLIYLDTSGRILDVNRKTVEVFGGSKGELLGKHFTRVGVFSRKDIPALESTFANILAGKKTTINTCIKNKKGREIHLECSASLMNTDGKIAGMMVIARDTTERRKAEETLRRSEERARHLLEFQNKVIDTADVWINLLDAEDNVTLWNRAAELISGYPREEVIGHKRVWEWLYPDPKYRAKIFAQAKEVIEERGRKENEETTISCKDGTSKTIRWYANSILDEKGKPVGSLAVGIDVTEIKKVQEKIRESEEKYRVLVESAADAIFTLDEAGNFLSANQEAAKALRKTPEEMIGKNMYDLFPKDIADLQMRKVKAVFQTGNPLLAEETLTQTKLGLRWYSTTIMPVRDSNGKIIYAMAISRDITERKKMEEKLRQYSEHLEELVQKRTEELLESEKRYSVLVEEASDGVVMIQDGKTIFANKKALEIVGYSRDELIDLPPEKLIDKKYLKFVKEEYDRTIRREITPSPSEAELITKTGERIPVEGSPALIHYQGRPAVIIIWRDIRERKRMEEERLKLEKLAAVGELATMVGHDLRNPLQAITNAVYILKNSTMTVNSALVSEEYEEVRNLLPEPIVSEISQWIENLLEENNKTINTIDESIKYANKIVSDLQDFARTKEPELAEADLESLIQETLSDISIPENIKVSIIHSQHTSKLYIDPNQIRRVFTNLTTNAIEAMPNGGKFTISTSLKNGFASIKFQDTGVGIPKENMKKLFIPFFTTRAKGMGMGLPICKKFVEMHGGTIQVESEEGKGSTFTVKLPIQQENRGEKPCQKINPASS